MPIEKVNSKTFKVIIVSIIIGAVAASAFFCFPRNDIYNQYSKSRADFGIIKYETINHEVTKYELKQSEKLIDRVSEALNYQGYKKDCYLGNPLENFCIFKDSFDYEDIVSEINFITFYIKKDKGYLWFTYNREMKVDNQMNLNEYDVLCLVEFKKTGNRWISEKVFLQKHPNFF